MTASKGKYDLKAEWDRACARYLETTGLDPRQEPTPTPSDVVAQIEAKRSRDAKDVSRISRVKDVAGKTLECVARFGEIAAQAAAMVWGPSTICMNAISFLIETGKSYRNIFTGLETLFTRIFEALERVELYMKHEDLVPEEVAKLAHEVLLKFLSICELSHRVLTQSKKWMMLLKAGAFDEDQGVSEELEALERLEKREARMGIASNVITSRAIQKNMEVGFAKTVDDLQEVKDSLQEAKKETDYARQMNFIREQLGDPSDAYRSDFRTNLNSLVPGTGEWISVDPELAAWADAQDNETLAVCLAAEQGFGKSFVFTRILHNLQQRYPQGMENAERVSIAWLYIHHEAKGVHSGPSISSAGPTSVDLILRTFAVEIAQNDPLYRKDLCTNLWRSRSDIDDVQTLAKRLFLDHSGSAATFFLLIDGVDELNEEQSNFLTQSLHVILTGQTRLKIKILLSGRPTMIGSLMHNVPSRLARIDVPSRNKSDVEIYVASRLQNMEIFKSAEMQSLRDEVGTSLTELIGGDFVYADILLKQIAAKQRRAEIRLVLEDAKAGGKRSDAIRSEIKRCNAKLDVASIRDLNILLLWVIHSARDLTIQELKCVLRIYGQEPSLKFFKQLRDDFNTFFTITPRKNIPNAAVSLASETLSDYFSIAAQEKAATMVHAQDHVSEAEIRLVKNFLHAFCEPNLYAKLGFDGFLDDKIAITNADISVPEAPDAHAEILIKCLQCINGKHEEESEPLKKYVEGRLEHHFSMIEDLSLVDPSLKAEIGSQLVGFLMNSDSVDGFAYRYKALWFGDSLVNEMSRFLDDGAVLRRLTESQRSWVRKHNSRSHPELDLLDSLAEGMARKWLGVSENAAIANTSFLLLTGYFNKIDHALHPEVERFPSPLNNIEGVPIETIYSMAAWAAERVDEHTAATKGKFNLGIILRNAKHLDDALEVLEEAKLLMHNDYYVDMHIAIALLIKKEHDRALSLLQPVIEALRSGVDVWKSGKVASDRQRCLRIMSVIHRSANRPNEVDRIYTQLLQEDLADRNEYFNGISTLFSHGKNNDIVDFLRRASQKPGKDSAENLLQELISTFPHLDKSHGHLFAAAHAVGELIPLKQQYIKALDRLRNKRNPPSEDEEEEAFRNYLLLKVNCAINLYRFGEIEEKEEAETMMREVLMLDVAQEVPSKQVRQLQWKQLKCFWQLAEIASERNAADGSGSQKTEPLLVYVRSLGNQLVETDADEPFHVNATFVRGSLGRALSRAGLHEEARRQLHTNVEVALALLSDDDPSNDWQGYRHLGDALMNFGDLENSIAAWSLIGPTQPTDRTLFSSQRETSKPAEVPDSAALTTVEEAPTVVSATTTATGATTTTTATKDVKPRARTTSTGKRNERSTPELRRAPSGSNAGVASKSEAKSEANPGAKPEIKRNESQSKAIADLGIYRGPLRYRCDGRCGRVWTYADDIYVCRDCHDVQLDAGCLALLRAGTLPDMACSKNHRFMHVPPWDQAKKDQLGPNHVQVGDKVVTIEDWLGGIKKDWSLVKEPEI